MTNTEISDTKREQDLQSTEPLIEARNLKKHFPLDESFLSKMMGRTNYVRAVDGVNLSVGRRETHGLVGESGCGKTTLGRTIARLYDPTDGTITFDGKDISNISGKELKQIRKNVQVIFQDPLSSLNPRKTAGEIIGKALKVHNMASGDEMRDRVVELLEEVELNESHYDRYPHEFSGGQRQRIGIARAIAVEPKLIIADEPVSALDVSIQAQIINLMKRLQNEYELSYIFIAHDLSVVKHISDEVSVMYMGKIVEQGPTDDIFFNPQHPYTRALLQAVPNVDREQKKDELTVLSGSPPSPSDPPSGCTFHTRCPEYIGEECKQKEPEPITVADAQGAIGPPDEVTRHDGVQIGQMPESHWATCHWLDKKATERQKNDPLSSSEQSSQNE